MPVIGCACEVCQSDDPRDVRLRCAALLQVGEVNIAIDVGPDFRQQMLGVGINHLDAILITHEHNDHIIGLDDVRPFNFRHRRDMEVYAEQRVQENLLQRFAYAFEADPYPGAPRLRLLPIHERTTLHVAGLAIEPIRVMHGMLPIFGFRYENIAYLTDVSYVGTAETERLRGVEVLVVSALHHFSHHSHFNLAEAVAFVQRVKPKRAYLLHCSHLIGKYVDVMPMLPPGIELAYDGLVIEP